MPSSPGDPRPPDPMGYDTTPEPKRCGDPDLREEFDRILAMRNNTKAETEAEAPPENSKTDPRPDVPVARLAINDVEGFIYMDPLICTKPLFGYSVLKKHAPPQQVARNSNRHSAPLAVNNSVVVDDNKINTLHTEPNKAAIKRTGTNGSPPPFPAIPHHVPGVAHEVQRLKTTAARCGLVADNIDEYASLNPYFAKGGRLPRSASAVEAKPVPQVEPEKELGCLVSDDTVKNDEVKADIITEAPGSPGFVIYNDNDGDNKAAADSATKHLKPNILTEVLPTSSPIHDAVNAEEADARVGAAPTFRRRPFIFGAYEGVNNTPTRRDFLVSIAFRPLSLNFLGARFPPGSNGNSVFNTPRRMAPVKAAVAATLFNSPPAGAPVNAQQPVRPVHTANGSTPYSTTERALFASTPFHSPETAAPFAPSPFSSPKRIEVYDGSATESPTRPRPRPRPPGAIPTTRRPFNAMQPSPSYPLVRRMLCQAQLEYMSGRRPVIPVGLAAPTPPTQCPWLPSLGPYPPPTPARPESPVAESATTASMSRGRRRSSLGKFIPENTLLHEHPEDLGAPHVETVTLAEAVASEGEEADGWDVDAGQVSGGEDNSEHEDNSDRENAPPAANHAANHGLFSSITATVSLPALGETDSLATADNKENLPRPTPRAPARPPRPPGCRSSRTPRRSDGSETDNEEDADASTGARAAHAPLAPIHGPQAGLDGHVARQMVLLDDMRVQVNVATRGAQHLNANTNANAVPVPVRPAAIQPTDEPTPSAQSSKSKFRTVEPSTFMTPAKRAALTDLIFDTAAELLDLRLLADAFDMPYAEMMAQVSKREGSFRQRAVEHAEV